VDAKKPENSKALVTLLMEIFLKKDRADWVRLLKENDLPYSITQHLREIPKDPLAWENGYLTRFTYPNGNVSVIPNTPVQFKENVAAPCLPAPFWASIHARSSPNSAMTRRAFRS
jgi:crotonobetainyl-CoA:carnitine CoA-transferase CaiB-like acyl-CoA transferase